MTSRQKRAQQTRRKIFMCAQELFARDQYENVKINDICAAAGVSIGAFYHYFPNKGSILNEGYRQFDIELEQHWKEHEYGSHLENIIFIIDFQLYSITANGHIGAAQFFKHQVSNEEKYILDKNRFFYVIILEEVQKSLDEGEMKGDAVVITDAIVRVTRGLIYDWCLHEGSYDIYEIGHQLLDMVLAYHAT